MTSPAASAPPQRTARWEDLIDLFVTPSAVFARRVAGGAGVPLLVLLILLTFFYYLNQTLLAAMFDAEFTRKVQELSRADAARAQNLTTIRPYLDAMRFVGMVVDVPMVALFTAILVRMVAWILSARLGFRGALVIATYGLFPLIVEQLVFWMQGLLRDPSTLTSTYSVTLSLARFLDVDSTPRVLMLFAGRVDVFAVWVAVWLALGIRATAFLSVRATVAAAALCWICVTLYVVLRP